MGDLINTQGGDYAAANIDKRSGTFTNVAIHEAPAPLALNLHQIPPPPRDFTGRTAELTELLANFEKGIAISGLHGQGGIGKTALALKLAEHLRPRYPDAQFYLDLKGASEQKPLTASEALAHVIRAYHPTSKLPEDEAQLRALYQTVLHNQRALLLMDNAKDAAQVESLLPPATCCLLVTSRQHFHLPGLHTKNLDTLPPADAQALLLTISERIGRQAEALANLCGYLPLALRLTASALAERVDLSPADLIRKLTDTQQRLKLTGAEASLQLSYDLLTADLQTHWRALAVFPETFDRAAASAVWELEEDKAHEALGELVKFSLLDYDPHPAPPPTGGRESLDQESPSPSGRGDRGEGELPGRYRLHDLARLYADSRLSEGERYEAQSLYAFYYGRLLGAIDLLLLNSESKVGLYLFDQEWHNIQAGQAWAAALSPKDMKASQICNLYPDAGVYVLRLRRPASQRIQWISSALMAAKRLQNKSSEGIHYGNLGAAYGDSGELIKAIEYSKKALSIARKLKEQKNESMWLSSIGVSYTHLGKPQHSIRYLQQALTISRKIDDLHTTGDILTNLGNSYSMIDDLPRALKFYEEALQADQETGNLPGKATALTNMATIYLSLNEPNQAIEFYNQSLQIAHDLGDRRNEGLALVNAGNAYLELKEPQLTLELCKKALIKFREIDDLAGEASSLFTTSLALHMLNKHQEAIKTAEASLEMFEKIKHSSAEKIHSLLTEWHEASSE